MALNLLIVDDSATMRAMIKRIVHMAGIDVHFLLEAPNGKAALEILAEVSVDVILADLHMPEMTGVELTRAILSNPATRNIPVVIVSAEPNAERIASLKKEGIRGYLKKPFTPEMMREVFNDVMGVANA